MARMIQCIRLKTEAPGLDFPPYPGELGQRIWHNVSKQAWDEWIGQQTMLINENRISLANAQARAWLRDQMEAHFFGDGAHPVAGYVPPDA